MSSSKVSVIVPVYKVPLEYLRACLGSLIAQTMQESEFILVSDGAPEAECSICEEFAARDSRFKFFKRKHAGVSATRNFGIIQASGEYITFVDSDDILLDNALEIWHKHAKKWNSDILTTNYAELNCSNCKKYLWKLRPIASIDSQGIESILREFICLKPNSIPRGPCGKIYRKNFISTNNISFDTQLTIGEDLFFNFISLNKATIVSFYPEVLYFYRSNPLSVTRAFSHNFYYDRIAPLLKIQLFFQNRYNDLLGREILDIFFQSWQHCYLHPQNKESFLTRMRSLKQILNSELFQNQIAKADTSNMFFILKLECFLFKRRFFFPIWLHAIKAFLFNGLSGKGTNK